MEEGAMAASPRCPLCDGLADQLEDHLRTVHNIPTAKAKILIQCLTSHVEQKKHSASQTIDSFKLEVWSQTEGVQRCHVATQTQMESCHDEISVFPQIVAGSVISLARGNLDVCNGTSGAPSHTRPFVNAADSDPARAQAPRWAHDEEAVDPIAGPSGVTLRPRSWAKSYKEVEDVLDGDEDMHEDQPTKPPSHDRGGRGGGSTAKRSKYSPMRKCKICLAELRGRKNLRKHMKRIHGASSSNVTSGVGNAWNEWNECRYRCPHCEVSFGSWVATYKHLKKLHPDAARNWNDVKAMMTKSAFHSCIECGKSVHADVKRITIHVRIHKLTWGLYFQRMNQRFVEQLSEMTTEPAATQELFA